MSQWVALSSFIWVLCRNSLSLNTVSRVLRFHHQKWIVKLFTDLSSNCNSNCFTSATETTKWHCISIYMKFTSVLIELFLITWCLNIHIGLIALITMLGHNLMRFNLSGFFCLDDAWLLHSFLVTAITRSQNDFPKYLQNKFLIIFLFLHNLLMCKNELFIVLISGQFHLLFFIIWSEKQAYQNIWVTHSLRFFFSWVNSSTLSLLLFAYIFYFRL